MKQPPPSFCHARLSNSGLGNKLFVWARAFVFARLNHVPLVVTGWTKFQLAPILHGGDWRLYLNYFRSVREINVFKQFSMQHSAQIVREPPVAKVDSPDRPTIYEFREGVHWSDYFRDLKPHREMIRKALFEMLTPARQCEYEKVAKPEVCIQIRMGDFRSLKQGEDFEKAGNTRTPLAYFINRIQGIREIHGSQIPITIISDGNRTQLQELLTLPAVELGARQTAIVDILRMARSKVLVPSASSTFGYWAGFLGDCAIIMHPDHIHKPIRPDSVNELFYEGPAPGSPEQWPELLKANIASI